VTRYFSIPYDSGQKGLRMGAGPLRLVQTLGVEAEEIHPQRDWRAEIATSFELYRLLAARVAASDDFPVVFSGNCGAAIGVAAGVGSERLGVIWFDAHGDYNTPETTDTGFLDGMCLAVLNGRCWTSVAATIPGFAPVDPRQTMHVGARDFSPGEREAMVRDSMAVVAPGALDRVQPLLDAFDVDRLLVHVDLDVLDPSHGRANLYAADGGLSPDEVIEVIEVARRRAPLAGLVLASYDPSGDPEGSIAAIAARIVKTFC
jgi:arginase